MNKNELRQLQNEINFVEYIKLVSSIKDYIIIIAVKDTIGFAVQADGYEALRLMGLSRLDYKNTLNNHWKGYVAVIENGEFLFEKLERTHNPVFFKGDIHGIKLDVVSAPLHGGNTASILINEKEYSTNHRGFNIVVVNRDGKVIDSVSFDTHKKTRDCTRTNQYEDDLTIHAKTIETFLNRNLEKAIKRLDVDYITNGWSETPVEKIKIRIYFFGWYVLWTAIETFVEALEDDPKYDVLIIMESKHEKTWEIISKGQHNLIYKGNYNIEEDCPDIMVYNSTIFVPQRPKSTILSAFVGNGLNDGGTVGFSTNEWFEQVEEKLNADLYIVEKHLSRKDKWYGVGNPKFDIIYRNIKKAPEMPPKWKKLKGKSVVLWATDHKWAQKDLTFDLYVKSFLDYFRTHDDMGLIVRIHPSYPSELIGAKVWTEEDYRRLKSYINSFTNVIWDERKDYGLAYSMADAVVTDINCGITISSLPLGIPIAVTLRYDGEICQPNFPDIIDALYNIHDVEEAFSFFGNVKNKKDPLKQKRNLIMKKYIANFDGKNGMRIKELIEKKYFLMLKKT